MTSHITASRDPAISNHECHALRAARRAGQKRGSKWAAIVYVLVALATPLLVYAGPVVMSPAAPMIAAAAMDGSFYVHAHMMQPN